MRVIHQFWNLFFLFLRNWAIISRVSRCFFLVAAFLYFHFNNSSNLFLIFFLLLSLCFLWSRFDHLSLEWKEAGMNRWNTWKNNKPWFWFMWFLSTIFKRKWKLTINSLRFLRIVKLLSHFSCFILLLPDFMRK